MAEILGPAPEAMSNEDIIRKFNEQLTQVIKSTTDPQYDFERLALVSQARYNWMMYRGMQSMVLGAGTDDYGGQMPDWTSFGASGQEETGAEIRLCPPMNVIAADGFKFIAVMGSSSPRVKGVPDDLRNPEDISSAHCADTNIRDLWLKNKIDRKWKIPAFHIYCTGPCFVRGFWNTDAVKYGTTTEPKIEIHIGEDGMPMPVIVGEEQYANGDAELSFHSVLEVSIPWEAKELRNNPLRLERMMNKYTLIAKYQGKDGDPGPLDKYRESEVPDDQLTGASVSAAEAKQATANPSGTAQTKKSNQWRFIEWWIPPHLYESIPDPEARKVIKTQFGRGLYIARVGSVTVEIDEREVTDEWSFVGVNREEKIMDRPVCADNIPLQRAINDLFGMAIETVLRAITQTLMDNQLIDREAMSTKTAIPAEIILTALPVDGDLQKRIFQIPPARLSDQVLPLMNLVRSWGQDISGVRPEISGGGQPTSTFREAKQRRDQALAQLAPQAQAMREAAEDVARILVTLRSKYGSGTVKAQRKSAYGVETDVADMADLQTSGWHPESDDQFPLTLSDRRDTLYSLLKEFSPDVAQALSLLDPLNVDGLLELLQLPGFESVIGEQKQKTLVQIDQLLAGAPIPAPPGPPGAPPKPPMPSVPADPFDDHVLVAKIASRWMISPVGQKHIGTPGFANVEAYWQAHSALATPPPPPPPPPVKASMAISMKAEDYPSLLPELLVGAGLPPPPPPPPQPPAIGPNQQMQGPAPIGGPQAPGKAPQANPIPPLQNGAAPPSQPPVQ
jgi:hypothetical protein